MLNMMIKRKRERRHTEDRYLALVLATSAGLLNAMALGAFGVFPSHMSGNTSQLSTEISRVDIRDLTFLLAIITAFVTGCVTARMMVIVGIRNNIRTIFSLILLTEGVLLMMMSAFELLFYSSGNNREVLVFLGFLMGIHNATSTQLSNGRVRSTHITGTLTDAGIALGSLLATLFRRDPSKEVSVQRKQFITHLITILSFLTGGIAGLLLFNQFGFSSMIAVGGFLVAIALSSIAITVQMARR
ncbi:YoaK family protein [Erwinia sp. MYb375]|uniref:YoaK family protein n=1 Tax=unclassified Erwinia TaxID=2622719 RepID=UPI0030A5035D